MKVERIVAILLIAVLAALTGFTQESTPRGKDAEAPEEKSVDGALSDEESVEIARAMGGLGEYDSWSELVAWLAEVRPFPKKFVIRIDEKYAYPHIVASFKMEYVREDDEYVWLRGISPEDPNSPLYSLWARKEAEDARKRTYEEALATPGAVTYIDFFAEEVPPPFMDSLNFEAVPSGLPTGGLWQMNFAVADMNEDRHPDLVFPPSRKALPPNPSIFLGDGTGSFVHWKDAKWPVEVTWDYGSVAAADFDGDGHQDLVYGFHFKPQFVLYGNGEGRFPRHEQLPSPDPRLTSRAVATADFDGDGREDVAFIAEVDYDVTTSEKIDGATTVWVLFNRDEGWQMETKGLPVKQIADVIRAGDMDGDGRPELVLSTNTIARRQLVYSYRGADGWEPGEHRGILSSAYQYNVEPEGEELFATFVQFRRIGNRTEARNGLVRYPAAGDTEEFVEGRPVVWDKERANTFFRLGTGDLNGDGLTDVVAGRNDGGLSVYVQLESGEFALEKAPGLGEVGRAFHIRLLDLDGDGLDDIIASCTSRKQGSGGIYVWLTRPAV